MIGIVNYGLGNIQAFINIYSNMGYESMEIKTSDEMQQADRLILPGVGSFDWAIEKINSSGLNEPLNDFALVKKLPILGVCIGMQIMANESEEGLKKGLGWIEGSVKKIPNKHDLNSISLPHMGWNKISNSSNNILFDSIEDPKFYFLHSYYFLPKYNENVISTTSYGFTFASAINSLNIYGTQFHPEKSHEWGTSLLQNFAEI